jgi:hypothetical protein
MKMNSHREDLAELFEAAYKVAFEQFHFDFAHDRKLKLTASDCKIINDYISDILERLVRELNQLAAKEAECNRENCSYGLGKSAI